MSAGRSDARAIREARKRWEEGTLKNGMQRLSMSQSFVEFFTPADLEGHDFLEDVGFPGEYPFTAGRHAIPIHLPFWGRGKALAGGKKMYC